VSLLLDGQYEATVLVGDSHDSFNDIEHPSPPARSAPAAASVEIEGVIIVLECRVSFSMQSWQLNKNIEQD